MDKFTEVAEKIDDKIWAAGYHVTHNHEDLVFFTHNHFIGQIEQGGKLLGLYINRAFEDPQGPLITKISEQLAKAEVEVVHRGSFELAPVPGQEELEIKFFTPMPQ